MRSLSTSVSASLILAAAVAASPVPHPQSQKRGTYTIVEGKPRRSFAQRAELSGQSLTDFIAAERSYVQAKYAQNLKNAQKNGLKKRSSTATIPLTDDNDDGVDDLYYGTMGMGTPSQYITFDFDTGSSDLWVPTQLSDGVEDGTHFDTSSSSSFKDTLQPFDVVYGSGAVVGTIATETVSFGDLTADSQYIGAVNVVSPQFDGDPATGLCGIAYQSIASTGQPSLPFTLYNQGVIPAPEFGFRLTRGTSDGAELTMGGVASDYSGSTFQQTPVTSQTYYEVGTNGMTVGDTVVTGSFPSAIDTGTTLLYVPTADAETFWAAIPGSTANGDGSYNYPCDFAGPVGVSFPGIGNLNFNIADLNIGQATVGSNMCTGAVQGMNIQDSNGNDFGIVGDTFIKSYYTVFNFGDNYVAFTPAHDNA